MEFISRYYKLLHEYHKLTCVDPSRIAAEYVIYIPLSEVLAIRDFVLSTIAVGLSYYHELGVVGIGPMKISNDSAVYSEGQGSHDLGVTFQGIKMQMAPVKEPALYRVSTTAIFDLSVGLRFTCSRLP